MTGLVNRIGAKSHIIGKTNDVQKNAWHIFRSASVDVSNGYIDFDYNVFIGSNISESAGKITVTEPGIYLCSFGFANYYAQNARMHSWEFFLEGVKINGTRLMLDGATASIAADYLDEYIGNSMTHPIRLTGGIADEIGVSGDGHLWGNTTSSPTWFTGAKIGERT